LKDVLKNENSGSDIFKKSYYYSYLIAVMTNDALLLFQSITKGADRDDFLQHNPQSVFSPQFRKILGN
jgi:hypothetical protein